MVPLLRSLILPFAFLFLPLVPLYATRLDEERHLNCSTPENCAGFDITYPFFLRDDREEDYCGHPGYGLECDDKKILTLMIDDDKYQVLDIIRENHSLIVARMDILHGDCPEQSNDFTLDHRFNFTNNDLEATLLLHCWLEDHRPPQLHEFNCFPSGSRVYLINTLTQAPDENSLKPYCSASLKIPMLKSAAQNLTDNKINPSQALQKGFEVSWGTQINATECLTCMNSRGACGYNARLSTFSCYCKDGAHQGTCSGKSESRWKVKLGIAAVAVGGTAIVMSLAFFFVTRYRRKEKQASYITPRSISSHYSSRSRMDSERGGEYYGLPIFEYDVLRSATNNFDPERELGDGGFGTVFYGKLQDGRAVAVKRLYEHNYKRAEQFMNEVEILAHLHHPNLVRLYGCTSRMSNRLLLVYEYVPNGTVADHLHGELAKPGSLPWLIRMNIAIQTASALVYLHSSEIIHRDVKTNNILLDENFKVKVADFGLSRLFPTNVTHVSTAPQGTPGYVDPEYHECYQLTEKSDVYSFGVVLMELISSLPAVDIMRHRHEINLSTMAINKIQNDAIHEFVDKNLGFESDYDARRMILAVAELGFRCLQNGKEMRPSMAEVLEILQNIQEVDSGADKLEKNSKDVCSDDVALLKVVTSPVSVAAKWVSSENTTPNASG